MAACFSFSSAPVKSSLLPLPLSSFKGNLDSLRVRVSFWFSMGPGHLFSSPAKPLIRCRAASVATVEASPSTSPVRFRLSNLGPQPGSRKRSKRKGRGKQLWVWDEGAEIEVWTWGRKGFEGGQMPLYRRISKLRGIAGANNGPVASLCVLRGVVSLATIMVLLFVLNHTLLFN